MRRSRLAPLLAAGALGLGATVATAQEPQDDLLAMAEDAADEASEAARELAEDAAEADGDGDAKGFGSPAFRERHAMLVAMFEDKGHPRFDEHPALRVHRALANGEHPQGIGQAQADAAKRMAAARKEMTGGGPPDHASRPDDAGRPDGAQPGGS